MPFKQPPDLIPIQSETAGPKRAKRADAVANRELILATAQRLFNEQGLENVKMVAIAEAAGLGQGTLYRAFANKGELCLALLDEDLQRFQEETLQVFRESAEPSPLRQLEAFLDRLIHFLDCHTTLMCEVQNYDIFGDEINHTGLHTWFHKTINLLLGRALAGGEIRPDIDLPYLTDAILAPLNPTLFTHQRRQLGYSLEQISHELRRLILEGIRVR